MVNNFLEAKKYFENLTLFEFLQGIVNKYQDQLEESDYSFENGFLALAIKSADETSKCPNILDALRIIGLNPSVRDNIYREFEMGYLSRSGEKNIAPELSFNITKVITLFDFDRNDPFETGEGPVAYDTLFFDLLRLLETRYGANLLRIAQTYFQEQYNPIENYSMVQVETPQIEKTLGKTSRLSEEGENSENTKVTNSSERHEKVHGFNSPTAVPVSDGDSESTTEGLDTDNNSNYSKSGESSESVTETETGSRRLTRAGNIGVTTSQQMLESELQLRKFDFLQYFYKCMDEIFVSSCYR